jgi:hypothetical protein
VTKRCSPGRSGSCRRGAQSCTSERGGPLTALVLQPWRWAVQVVNFWGTVGLAMFGIRKGRI